MISKAILAAIAIGGASAFAPTSGFAPGKARIHNTAGLRAGIAGRAPVALTGLRMQTATGQDTAALTRVATEARGLAMDSIAAAKSGHLGLPLGCAEVSNTFPFWPAKARLWSEGCCSTARSVTRPFRACSGIIHHGAVNTRCRSSPAFRVFYVSCGACLRASGIGRVQQSGFHRP